jgi:hypothetical protein
LVKPISYEQNSSLILFFVLNLFADDESEAKFLALKTLQMKKLKQLTAQLDAKDRDISKLKILNKVGLYKS